VRTLATMALLEPTGVLEVLAELEPMRDIGDVSLDEAREVLTERLTLLRAEPIDKRYGKVFIATTEEAAARSFDIVFLPGLAEGLFPKKAYEDPLLLDAERRKLSSDLRVMEDRSQEERLLLARAIGAAKVMLFASYPRIESGEGKPRG